MLIFDLESNGLLNDATVIHCVSVLDPATGATALYHDDEDITPRTGSLVDGLVELSFADALCGHNIIRYDLPLIRKLYPDIAFRTDQRIYDTLAAARVIWTDLTDQDFARLRTGALPAAFQKAGLVGSQSLEAWGMRLGVAKGDFKGPWDTFTQDMATYAVQDVVVTRALYDLQVSKQYSAECLELEFDVARIVAAQERRGFGFDVASAEKLYAELQKRRVELEAAAQQVFAPWEQVDRVFTPKRDNRRFGYKAGVQVTKMKTVIFNPGSRDHIADRLMKVHGWVPEEYTDGGKPKVDETVLEALPYPEAKTIAEYLMVTKRLGQLGDGKEAWLKAVENGRIHGQVNTNGAVTGRMTHFRPNVAQVPRVGSPYGHECRSLFIAAPGRVLVGCDAEGLELRMLAHFMARYDGGAYVETVVNGRKEDQTDIHNVNKRAVGLNSRDSAKTFIYALIYGAGDYKLGTIVYADFSDEQKARFDAAYPSGRKREGALRKLGTKRRGNLMSNLPALGKLVDAVKAAAKRGYLKGLDGRHLHVRSDHAALNTLLQSGGAVVMKKALVLLDREARRRALACDFVANVHDEYQIETEETHASLLGPLAADAIVRAGEHFNLRCPLAGSFNVGRSWADTH